MVHHPGLRRSGVGGLVGFYDVPRDTSSGECKSADCSRDTSVADGDIEMETQGSYSAASSQLSRDEDGDDGPPLQPSTQPITGAGVG